MIGIVAKLKVKPGSEAEFETLFTALAKKVRANEPGCVLYDLFRLRGEAGSYIVQEQYRDEAALGAHRSTPHMAEAGPKLGQVLAGRPEIQMLDKVD